MKHFNPYIHHRRSIRLKGYDYSQSGIYFVTICLKDAECLLGEVKNNQMTLNPAGKMIESEWRKIPEKYPFVDIDEFIVMPNHMHGLISIKNKRRGEVISPLKINNNDKISLKGTENVPLHKQSKHPSLGQIIAYFKYKTTKSINIMCDTPCVKLWQRNYYEHIIRNENGYNRIRNYIIQNPSKWNEDKYNPKSKN